jgi:hypothetical protein
MMKNDMVWLNRTNQSGSKSKDDSLRGMDIANEGGARSPNDRNDVGSGLSGGDGE